MPSVFRDKRNNGVSIGGETSGNLKKRRREKSEEIKDEIDRDPRRSGYNGYHVGRVRPLIEDDQSGD